MDETEEKPELSLVEKAEAVANRIEAANKKAIEILTKNEETLSRIMLSGKANAGQTPIIETPEDKWRREAKIRYAGTGMDPT